MEKLSQKQVIRALRRLERGWPEDLWIFVGDGTLTLMEKDVQGDEVETTSGGVDPNYAVDRFPHIRADGGGW